MNKSLHPVNGLLLALLISLMLGACATQPTPESTTNPAVRAARAAVHDDQHAHAAELYAKAARNSRDTATRNTRLLEAGIQAIHAQQNDKAEHWLADIDPSQLNTTDRQRYRLAHKLLETAALPPRQALSHFPEPAEGTTDAAAAWILQIRARLLFRQGRPIQGIHALVQRNDRLESDQAIQDNNRDIFRHASAAARSGYDSAAAHDSDAITRGWLTLAEVDSKWPEDTAARTGSLRQWAQQHADHPARQDILPRLLEHKRIAPAAPAIVRNMQIGHGPIILALPLSGAVGDDADAIRAGFEMAHGHAANRRRVQIIDSSNLSARQLLARARADQAAILVGPLLKDKVRALAGLNPGMPVLALNQVHDLKPPVGFHQYALAPEDDIRTVIAYAEEQGWHRALALVPQNQWGNRVLSAFRDILADHGGQLAGYAQFETDRYDHKEAVLAALSNYRAGTPVDFVFLAARPVHARLLRSQIRFYRGAKLPVVGTSDMNSGLDEPRQDEDLNGVVFAALPWFVGQSRQLLATRLLASTLDGDQPRLRPSLFAMGIDASRLTDQWLTHGLAPGTKLPGTTGILKVQSDGRIRRYPDRALFRNGHAELLSRPPIADTMAIPMPTQPVDDTAPATHPDVRPDNRDGGRPDSSDSAGTNNGTAYPYPTQLPTTTD